MSTCCPCSVVVLPGAILTIIQTIPSMHTSMRIYPLVCHFHITKSNTSDYLKELFIHQVWLVQPLMNACDSLYLLVKMARIHTCKTGSCAHLSLRNTDWPEQTREHRIYNSIQLPAFRHTISVVLKVQCNCVNVA